MGLLKNVAIFGIAKRALQSMRSRSSTRHDHHHLPSPPRRPLTPQQP